MNATEMGRRSDSLYYDNVSRRELCDRIAHLESDLDAAKNDLSIFSGELVKSKAENIKLRKLVRDAWGNGHPDKSCGDCEIMDECHAEIEEAHKKGNGRWNNRCLFERRIEDRMRELGIEV